MFFLHSFLHFTSFTCFFYILSYTFFYTFAPLTSFFYILFNSYFTFLHRLRSSFTIFFTFFLTFLHILFFFLHSCLHSSPYTSLLSFQLFVSPLLACYPSVALSYYPSTSSLLSSVSSLSSFPYLFSPYTSLFSFQFLVFSLP